ncbi:MAG: tRNA epoxyqueuosine(34) reductase QueG [Myxococcota bacterium]
MTDVAAAISARAEALGFDAVGMTRADVPLEDDYARYRDFIAAGFHGEMGYLAAHGEVRARLDTDAILAGARTVICLARRYAGAARDEPSPGSLGAAIARYARGRDYHNHLRKRLQRLAAFVRGLAPGTRARALVDTAPVLERAWAARAGLGFVGKNGLLIVPGVGSFVLLGEVVTTLEVPASALGTPMADRCGHCRACLDACPTDAFVRPFVLDARRCLAYGTIERKSVPTTAPETPGAAAEHVFGCDDCQTACPYNRAPRAALPSDSPFALHARWSTTSLAQLVTLDDEGFARLTEGSPLRRAGRRGLARNALMAAAARGDADTLAAGRRHDDEDVAALARVLSEEVDAPRSDEES